MAETAAPPTNRASKWAEILSKADPSDWLRSSVVQGLVQEIVAIPGRKTLEVGCGTALVSALLCDRGYQAVAIDRDEEVLTFAAEQIIRLSLGRPRLIKTDAFGVSQDEGVLACGPFDLCFSQGLLEHFEGPDVLKLIREQLKLAPVVIFSVPSWRYPEREYGDERRLRVEEWARILFPLYGEAEVTVKSYAGDLHILGRIERNGKET